MNAFFEFVLILMCLSAGNAQFEDRPPPHYSSDHLPETKFTCEGKFTGRYYADPDTDCQMFHICSKTSRRDVSDFKFLCPNGTVFDQDNQVCADYYQVVCQYDSNSFGSVFEIYKLSSKESTDRREFGNAPPLRDPAYIGQNYLSTEEFQAEEYNNNKLASSQNALAYHASRIESKERNRIFASTTEAPRAFPTKRVTTERVTRPPTPARNRARIETTSTTYKPRTQATTTPRPENFSRRRFETNPPASNNAPSSVSNQNFRPAAQNPRREFPTTRNSFFVTTTTTAPPRRPDPTTDSSPSLFDTSQFQFSDFASLSKFQTQFHRSFASKPKTTQKPTTTTEYYSTTTYSPLIEYTEVDDSSEYFQEYEGTTPQPTTTRNFQKDQQFRFSNFRNIPQSQGRFEDSSPTQSTTDNYLFRTTANLDFNTRPRSETQAPEFQTSRRTPIFQNTFRSTYQDFTTSRPQTFKQQPSRFSEDFFRKIETQPDSHQTRNRNPDFLSDTSSRFESRENSEENGSIEADWLAAPRRPTSRPVVRRRRPRPTGERQFVQDPRYKSSRRVQHVRFLNRSSVRAADEENTVEIFDAEESIHGGSTGFNSILNSRQGHKPDEEVKGEENDSTPRLRQKVFFGRRVFRPSNEERAQDGQDSNGRRTVHIRRGRKRLRPRPSSSTEKIEFVTPTTYRPSNRLHSALLLTTTTAEPELVTASDDEINRLRSRAKDDSTNTEQPAILSLKLSSKFSSQKPIPTSTKSNEDSKVSDYDYSYYDTDPERYFTANPDTFGSKFTEF